MLECSFSSLFVDIIYISHTLIYILTSYINNSIQFIDYQ
jgi:hypothetical protein